MGAPGGRHGHQGRRAAVLGGRQRHDLAGFARGTADGALACNRFDRRRIDPLIPAQAGIQDACSDTLLWVPAFAGTTTERPALRFDQNLIISVRVSITFSVTIAGPPLAR